MQLAVQDTAILKDCKADDATDTKHSAQTLRTSLKGYALDDATLQKLRLEMDSFASARVTLHCQEAANTIMARMKDR